MHLWYGGIFRYPYFKFPFDFASEKKFVHYIWQSWQTSFVGVFGDSESMLTQLYTCKYFTVKMYLAISNDVCLLFMVLVSSVTLFKLIVLFLSSD